MEAMLVLVHLPAGVAARQKSLLSITVQNACRCPRHLLLLDGEICFYITHSENQGRSRSKGYIFCFIPHVVGRLIFAYLVFVELLLSFLETMASQHHRQDQTQAHPQHFRDSALL